MENPVLDFFKSNGSFLYGSLRIILFLSCLLVLVVDVFSLIAHSQHLDELPDWIPQGLGTGASHYWIHGILVLSITLLGCYGSFYRHQTCLKVFSVLIVLYSIYSLITLVSTVDTMALENSKINERLQNSMKNYQWESTNTDIPLNDATKTWNNIQKLACCGLQGQRDWDTYRPSSIANNMYPASCCMKHTKSYCPRENTFTAGCSDRIKDIEDMGLTACWFMIAFQIALAFLSSLLCIIGIDQESGRQTAGPMLSIVDCGDIRLNYEKFSSSANGHLAEPQRVFA